MQQQYKYLIHKHQQFLIQLCKTRNKKSLLTCVINKYQSIVCQDVECSSSVFKFSSHLLRVHTSAECGADDC